MDTLLPYLVDHIEDSKDRNKTAEQASAMYIFPYRTEEGTRLGSMRELGISWYFTKEAGMDVKSSGGYRIFDDAVFKGENTVKFRRTFGEYSNISEFSDAAVIKDLIDKMSEETEYTDLWWTYAYDVFKLWNEDIFSSSLKKATENMDNNSFLFLEGYCSEEIKYGLIEQGVFVDIVTDISKCSFWNKISSKEEKAIDVLKKMGVPHSFAKTEKINEYLLRFLEDIAAEVEFPVMDLSDNYEKCELCHDIFWNMIFKEYDSAFNWVANQEAYKEGLVIKNVKKEFIPLSWDSFYLDAEIIDKDNKEDAETSEEVIRKSDSELEHLHIDASYYSINMFFGVETIHEFSDVNDTVEDYSFGVDVENIEFYMWLWHYSQHEKLAENILYFFTNDAGERNTVSEEYTEFILAVLGTQGINDEGYLFDIDLEVEEAFEYSEVLNRISRKLREIYCVAYGEFDPFDANEYLPQIVAATNSFAEIKNKIATDPIWDHVYLVKGKNNTFSDIYVRCKLYEDDYEDVLLLYDSEDKDSYIRAMAIYVKETYDVEVAISAVESFDWKLEYLNLAKSMRDFVTEKWDVKSIEDMSGITANMNDILNFGEEKSIWEKLKKQRSIIISQLVGKSPINLDDWRSFLTSKYKGRCQLCGAKTITGEQNTHFFTYRITKESENKLANMRSNMFCLCPSCHGEMRYGSFMGKDMSDLLAKAELYIEYIEQKISSGEMEDEFECLVHELVEDDIEIEGFFKPIVCKVIINGKMRNMTFSWEHFMRIAFILGDTDGEELDNVEN